MREFETKIKNYSCKAHADIDCFVMQKIGFDWFSGWYTSEGFSVEYHKYI